MTRIRVTAVVSCVFVACGMLILSSIMTGPHSGDWLGYAELYGDQGGWLLDQKRDPGFLVILNTAHAVFGQYGYANFRLALSIMFGAFALWLVYLMPVQPRVRQVTALASTIVVLVAFSLKSFVQIREGLAFLFILTPLAPMFSGSRKAVVASGLGAVAALAFHSGTVVLTGAWVIACVSSVFPNRFLLGRKFHQATLVAGVFAGIVLGAFTVFHAAEVRRFLGGYGVNVHVKPISGFLKSLYWVLNGMIAWKIRTDLLGSLSFLSKFTLCYVVTLASIVVPMSYAICTTLVISGFELPALTSMMIRLFFTLTELGLIIIALRGKMNVATCAIAVFMLIDRLRVAGDST